MKFAQQSDEWLMGQVARGGRDCLDVLVRRYATPLLTYLVRMSGDVHLSEELLQEVFLAVWIKRKTYEPPRRFKSWLYAIATNRCRAAFRGAKRQDVASLHGNPAAAPVSGNPAPDDVAWERERASLVNAALARLPEHQRMVVTLRVWGGLSYAAIADVAGRPIGTVRSDMHRALAVLRRRLSPVLAGRGEGEP